MGVATETAMCGPRQELFSMRAVAAAHGPGATRC